MSQYRARNTISGKEGRAFLDGVELFQCKKIEATMEKEKSEVKVMGRRMTGHKTIGGAGTGTLTIYKATSQFVEIAQAYVKRGEDPYLTIETVTDDKSSGRGAERVILRDVNLDSVMVANLDADAEVLEEEIPFTFEDLDVVAKHKRTV